MQRMTQEQESASIWPQDMAHDSLASGVGEVDFTKFLDLEDGFEPFQQLNEQHSNTSLETPMGRLAFGQQMQHTQRHNQDMIQDMNMSVTLSDSQLSAQYADISPSAHNQYQQYQIYQQMRPSHRYQVPPTPVSAEMHAAKYSSQMENASQVMFERHQASFTPLVSPAQTPHDNSWGMPDYVPSDDFFSPLTSPAIEAQPNFSTNTTASPVDLNAELPNASQTSVARKGGRRKTPQQPRTAVRNVRQSPAMKPQAKRRQFSLSGLPMDKIENMLENHAMQNRLQVGKLHGNAVTSSEDSVSPEPLLSEALMRPPPVPSNAGKSPIDASAPRSSKTSMPATPAMLMRMPGKQSVNTEHGAQASNLEVMEDISLPDAAADLPPQILPENNTTIIPSDDQSTPTLSGKTPKLSADSTPRGSVLKAISTSDTQDKMKRLESRLGGRGSNKKRQSVSATISPALRPKISPSISPLVPTPGPGTSHLSAETSALYLASKSNYQNILDGTHLPGVSYPETLAENLSSKRTSHKLAEQGRRNRINVALKEIEALLPASITAAAKKEKANSSKDEEGSPDKGGSAAQGASKASTVEMAIIYIRNLQSELRETREKLEAAEQTIADGSKSRASSSSLSSEADRK